MVRTLLNGGLDEIGDHDVVLGDLNREVVGLGHEGEHLNIIVQGHVVLNLRAEKRNQEIHISLSQITTK